MLVAMVAAAFSQSDPMPPDKHPAGDVVVVGMRERFRIGLAPLRAAQAAFAKDRARYAPASTLAFLVERTTSAAAAGPVRLVLTDGMRRTAITVGGDGRFTLPDLPTGKAWIEADLARRAMRVTPLVLSPGATRTAYRLGDARLQCRAMWAMEKATASVLEAPLIGIVNVAGPCTNRKIGIYVSAPGVIRTAIVREGERTLPIAIGRTRRGYRLPVDDRTFGDEALVEIATE